MTAPLLIAVVAVAGAACGTLLAGALETYTRTLDDRRSLRPWPPCESLPPRQLPLLFVPLIGPLAARRPLAACPHHGPYRLLTVQAAMGLLWGILAARYGATPLLPVAALEGTLLLAVVFTDMQHRLVPHGLVVPGALLALATSGLWPGLGPGPSLLGGLGAFVVFVLLVRLAGRVFGQGAFGQGDANLAGWIGLLYGYPLVVVALSVGIFLGGIGAVVVLVLRRGSLRATMPYGPYLVAGALYILVAGSTFNSPYTYI